VRTSKFDAPVASYILLSTNCSLKISTIDASARTIFKEILRLYWPLRMEEPPHPSAEKDDLCDDKNMNDMATARKLMAGTAEQSFEHNDGELLLEDCVLRGNLVAL